MTKLFITGATGYIGGDALYAIANTYPDLEITALVRNSDKGAKIGAQYSKIKLVYGDLDSSDLLTTEASKADIVLHCAHADHIGAADALVAGVSQSQTPTYLIHTSGTGIVATPDAERKTYGVHAEKIYNDWDGIDELISLPDHFVHRNVDKVILAAGDKNPGKTFTAVVCPPLIYGPGRGPDNQRSMQIPEMTNATLKRGKGFQLGEGKNRWTQVHVQDLSEVYLSLVTSALEPGGGKATWNAEGYYFAESGEFVWSDVGRAIAKLAVERKLIETEELDSISHEEADDLTTAGSYLWGTNSRVRAIRANKLFGWTPKQKSLFDTLPDVLALEAKALGLAKSHIEIASGQ